MAYEIENAENQEVNNTFQGVLGQQIDVNSMLTLNWEERTEESTLKYRDLKPTGSVWRGKSENAKYPRKNQLSSCI